MKGKEFQCWVGTKWCPLGAFELSIAFLDGSKKKRESIGVRGESGFQSEPSESVLDGLNVPSGYHIGYTHPAPKNFS